MDEKADIGLIGLAVMGQNLVLNMNDKGYSVAAFNRTVSKVDDFLNGAAKGRDTIYGAHSLEEFMALLKRPRKMMLMVKAGSAVDDFIEQLLPHLDKGDLIIDGGNSHFPDSTRRTEYLKEKGRSNLKFTIFSDRWGESLRLSGNLWLEPVEMIGIYASKTYLEIVSEIFKHLKKVRRYFGGLTF